MSEEEDSSFLLVGIEDESQGKEQISIINRESSNITNNKEINEDKKDEKSCLDQLLNKLLSLDKSNKARKKNEKYTEEDFFTFDFFPEKKEYSGNLSNSFGNLSGENLDTSIFNYKKKSIIKNIIDLKKENEWNEFIKEYKKDKKKKNKIKILFKKTFNINSDFILIWKFFYSLFYMIIFFFAFMHFIFFELVNINDKSFPKKRFIYLYYIINFMFLLDLILSILIIISNKGSLFSYLKIPIKLYLVIPFPLEKKYIIFLLPKFCRVDLFRRVFQEFEHFIVEYIIPFIQNYHVKIFILYINRLFAYLLEFGLYAHFACCLYCYLDDVNYINGIFYTIEIITTIGYGEHSPKNVYSMILVMVTIFIGSNLVIVTNCNINYLTKKLHSFSRNTSPGIQLETFIFHIQSSTGKLFPKKLKESLDSFIKFHQGLSFENIISSYFPIFSLFRPKIREDILKESLDFLRLEYKLYFTGCEIDFINALFAALKPRIYGENKNIINIGQKVNKLHFLLNGVLFAFDVNDKFVYNIDNNSIFCEYEFITGLKSEFNIKTLPNSVAYGFVINKKDWDNISKKYIFSTKKFIKLCVERRKNFVKKLNKIYENKKGVKNKRNDKIKCNRDNNIFDEISSFAKNVGYLEESLIRFKKILFENLFK